MKKEISKEEAKRLYDAHYIQLVKFATFLLKSKANAEDIVSMTFIKCFEKYYQWDDSKPILPWLRKILINEIRQEYRRSKRIIHMEEPITDLETLHFVEELLIEDRNKVLWRCVEHLKPKLRTVVVMHYYESLTLPEISKVLNIPVGTCKSRLNSALTQLRQYDFDERRL